MKSRYDRGAWERRRKAAGTRVEVADRVELPVDAATAWSRLRDVDTAASCLPGIVPGSLRATDEGTYEAELRQTALGVSAVWALHARLLPADADRRLDVKLAGDERRLGMRLEGEATVAVADGSPAALDYHGTITVEGRLAASGGPIVRGAVEGTLRRFVDSLAGREPEASRPRVLRRLLHRLTGRR